MRPVAQIAQSVEQRIENPRVRGSIPRLGTIYKGLLLAQVAEKKVLRRLSSVGRATDL